MVFSSSTFLFLFLPAVIFFYWLPDVCAKIKLLFFKKSLDKQGQNLALYSQTANADFLAILADFSNKPFNKKYKKDFRQIQSFIPLFLLFYKNFYFLFQSDLRNIFLEERARLQ